MVRKAFDILRHRWPEVMLIVVLHAALMVFAEELASMSERMASDKAAQIPAWAGFLMGFGAILYAVIWMMLYLGFFKTAALEGANPQQPMHLLQSGRIYFWKILGFQILYGVILWILGSALFALLGALLWRANDLNQIPDWFAQLCVLAGLLFLLKPLLLIPARIIAADEPLGRAALSMRYDRLRDIDGLYKLFAASLAGIMLFMFISGLAPERSVVYYVLSGIHNLLFSLVFLWMTLAAVLYVQQQLDRQQESEAEG